MKSERDLFNLINFIATGLCVLILIYGDKRGLYWLHCFGEFYYYILFLWFVAYFHIFAGLAFDYFNDKKQKKYSDISLTDVLFGLSANIVYAVFVTTFKP